MFHIKEQPSGKAAIYELLKNISPITIKSKLVREGLTENHSFAFRGK
jgi:hypothetical protein